MMPSQTHFQDPCTPAMKSLNEIYDSAMTTIILILTYVLMTMYSNITKSESDYEMETMWTMLPGIIILTLAVPSLRLLYLLEESLEPTLNVSITRHQWYWSYDYTSLSHLQFDSLMLPTTSLFPGEMKLLETGDETFMPWESKMCMMIMRAKMDVLMFDPWANKPIASTLPTTTPLMEKGMMQLHMMGGELSQSQPSTSSTPTKVYEVFPNIIFPHNNPPNILALKELFVSGEPGVDMRHELFTDPEKIMNVVATCPKNTTNPPQIHMFNLKLLSDLNWYFESKSDSAIFKFPNKINDSINWYPHTANPVFVHWDKYGSSKVLEPGVNFMVNANTILGNLETIHDASGNYKKTNLWTYKTTTVDFISSSLTMNSNTNPPSNQS